MIPTWFIGSFWGVALVVSYLLGEFCFEIHGLNRKAFTRAARNHQRWFNSTGSVFGWVALWCLVRRAWAVGWMSSGSFEHATLSDFVLAFVAFVGICGYVPYTVMGIIDALKVLVQKALDRAIELTTGKT